MARPIPQMPVLQMYCTIAIVPTAATKCDKSWNLSWSIGPKHSRTIRTVSEVEKTIMPELKAMTRGVLLMRRPENKPSTAASKIPASPPYSKSTRKMKVSEIVMLVLTRGIWTEKRALTTTMIEARIRNRQPNFGTGSQSTDAIMADAPAKTITQRKASSDLFGVDIRAVASTIGPVVNGGKWFRN